MPDPWSNTKQSFSYKSCFFCCLKWPKINSKTIKPLNFSLKSKIKMPFSSYFLPLLNHFKRFDFLLNPTRLTYLFALRLSISLEFWLKGNWKHRLSRNTISNWDISSVSNVYFLPVGFQPPLQACFFKWFWD